MENDGKKCELEQIEGIWGSWKLMGNGWHKVKKGKGHTTNSIRGKIVS